MNAAQIAKALNGKRVGSAFKAPCPSHRDRKPSLAIRDAEDGRVLLFCHARCPSLVVIRDLQRMGLWPQHGDKRSARSSPSVNVGEMLRLEEEKDRQRRLNACRSIWIRGRDPEGTATERYLQLRNVELPRCRALRHYDKLPHPSGTFWPAMLAVLEKPGTDGMAVVGIHRTFLTLSGEKAPVEGVKLSLGNIRGGGVYLDDTYHPVLFVAEGIETTLAAHRLYGSRDATPVSALSAPGMASFAWPAHVKEIVVFGDNDPTGTDAANRLVSRAASTGLKASAMFPPKDGWDWADMLTLALERGNG